MQILNNTSHTYRAEIDGLRALAVLSVLFFHFEFKLFPGGFVGVDIFFVISGFLITRIIHNEVLETGKFNFLNFYARRIKRIFPSLFFILAITFLIAFFIFPPQHFERLGGAIFHALLSISNFYFWAENGYFDTLSEFKPILHTWSLGVEEQFYLIWPIMILFFVRKNLDINILLILIGLISLLLNFFYVENSATIYFLTPFRIFEFVIGGLLISLQEIKITNKYLVEFLQFIGLFMIGYSVFYFDKDIIFPSYNALIPTIGAALIIFSQNKGVYLHKILVNKVVVYIGLISYSLYVVHWPLYVFYKYLKVDELLFTDKLILLLLSFILAYFIYTFIEKPFRYGTYKKLFQMQYLNIVSILIVVLIFLGLTLSAWMTNGWVWRFPRNLVEQLNFKNDEFHKYVWKKLNELEKNYQENGNNKVLVIGDSMAGNFVNILNETNQLQKLDLVTIPVRENCKATFILQDNDYNSFLSDKIEVCRDQHKAIINDNRINQADVVVLASAWEEWNIKLIPTTIEFLKKKGVKKIFVTGVQGHSMDGIKFIAYYGLNRNAHEIKTQMNKSTIDINNKIKQLNGNFIFVDLLDAVCTNNECIRVTREGNIITYDFAHLTPIGAKYVGGQMLNSKYFKELK